MAKYRFTLGVVKKTCCKCGCQFKLGYDGIGDANDDNYYVCDKCGNVVRDDNGDIVSSDEPNAPKQGR